MHEVLKLETLLMQDTNSRGKMRAVIIGEEDFHTRTVVLFHFPSRMRWSGDSNLQLRLIPIEINQVRLNVRQPEKYFCSITFCSHKLLLYPRQIIAHLLGRHNHL